MVRPERVTLDQVRKSFRPIQGDKSYAMNWFGRPLAHLVTPFFYNTGWTADQITLFRIGLAVLGMIVLGLAKSWSAVAYIAIYYVVFVLDCVDGNIARLADSASYWGKFIDGLGDLIFMVFTPFVAGYALWSQTENATLVLWGAVATVLCACTQLARSRLSFFREWMVSQSGPITTEQEEKRKVGRRIEAQIAWLSEQARFLAPLVLLLPNGWMLFVSALLVVHLGTDFIWFCCVIQDASILLRRHRVSKFSAAK